MMGYQGTWRSRMLKTRGFGEGRMSDAESFVTMFKFYNNNKIPWALYPRTHPMEHL